MPTPEFKCRKVLVATDFSEAAAAALGRAAQLAERAEAELTVVHVIEDPTGAVPATSFEFDWTIPPGEIRRAERRLRAAAEERLVKLIKPFQATIRKLRSEVCVGVPFVEIIRAALRKNVDLVVAGTRGLSVLPRLLVGSTAERLVRKCPCPVWVVKPEYEWPLRSILVPVDFTPVSHKSLKVAAFLAGVWGCQVTVLHVVNFPGQRTTGESPDEEMDANRQRREFRKAAARRLSEFVAAHCTPAQEVQQCLAVGHPWRMIGNMAQRLDAGLILMGSVGRTGIPGFFIGNIAEKVLRTCDRSILTVKPDGFESPFGIGN